MRKMKYAMLLFIVCAGVAFAAPRDAVDPTVDRAFKGCPPGATDLVPDPRFAPVEREELASVGFSLMHLGDHAYFIGSVREKSSAQESGVKPGEYLFSVNGTKCTGISSNALFHLLSGNKGTSVKLVLATPPDHTRVLYVCRDSPPELSVTNTQEEEGLRVVEEALAKQLHEEALRDSSPSNPSQLPGAAHP